VLHGHYHLRLSWASETRAVEGLAHDKSSRAEALAVIDLEAGAPLVLAPA
jgi:hypothetical protein